MTDCLNGEGTVLHKLFYSVIGSAFLCTSREDIASHKELVVAGGGSAESAQNLLRSAMRSTSGSLRRQAPPPKSLEARIVGVIDAFREAKLEGGEPLFKNTMDAAVSRLLVHVRMGCLSDSQALSLYYGEIGQRLSCGRGTGPLEAMHRFVESRTTGYSYGAVLIDAIMAEFFYIYNASATMRLLKNPVRVSAKSRVILEDIFAIADQHGVRVPDSVTMRAHRLAPNNGEIFGVGDIGSEVRDLLWSEDRLSFEKEDSEVSAAKHDGSALEISDADSSGLTGSVFLECLDITNTGAGGVGSEGNVRKRIAGHLEKIRGQARLTSSQYVAAVSGFTVPITAYRQKTARP